jgi:hypothetical protein
LIDVDPYGLREGHRRVRRPLVAHVLHLREGDGGQLRGGGEDTEKERTTFEDDKLISYTYVCPYERIWRSNDRNDVGLLYCENFHHAMWQAYRSDLDVQIPEILTKDDPHCLFVVTQLKP